MKLRKQLQGQEEEEFVEIVVNRPHTTLQQLLTICCTELAIEEKNISKLRKLPNTVMRNNQDVQTLRDYDELELVVSKVR